MLPATLPTLPAAEQGQSLGFARSLAWVSLVLVLALSAVLSMYIGSAARATLLAKQKEFSSLLAENLNNQIYRRFTLPTVLGFGRIALRQPAQYERLDQVVQSTIHGLHLGGLRIFDHEKTVNYSTNREELGRTDLASASLASASTSENPVFEIEAAMPYWRAFFTFPLAEGSFTLRTSYPLRIENRLNSSEETGPIMGVLEFTQDITLDMERAIRFQQLIVVVTLLSSVLFLSLLLFFIRRAERAMRARMAKEQSLLNELHQHEKLAGMGRVVASIAHEIRNPLGIIRSSAELLLKRPSTDTPTSRILQAIYDEAKRLSQTVNDFLDYARPRSPRKDCVNIQTVLSNVLAFLEHEMVEHNIGLVRTGTLDAPLWVAGDSDLLYRAFYNILSNALQAIGKDGTLTIGVTASKGPLAQVEVSVQDSGSGFAPENLPQILDPFFTTKDNGTGLGLPIVNSIITSHGGSLRCENAPDGGALVTTLLPQAQQNCSA